MYAATFRLVNWLVSLLIDLSELLTSDKPIEDLTPCCFCRLSLESCPSSAGKFEQDNSSAGFSCRDDSLVVGALVSLTTI